MPVGEADNSEVFTDRADDGKDVHIQHTLLWELLIEEWSWWSGLEGWRSEMKLRDTHFVLKESTTRNNVRGKNFHNDNFFFKDNFLSFQV